MSIKIDGIDRLIKKLDKLSHIETEKAIEDVAETVEKAIRAEAKKFSDTSYLYIGKSKKRKYGMSCYIDIGFHKDNAPFELWKPLWFQNWGYWDKGLNFNGNIYISNHQLWFDEAIKSVEKDAQRNLKNKIKEEISSSWNE